MSLTDDQVACAKLVERGDPLRFRAAMAAPVSRRGHLFALYAFNVEVSRAPWVTQETMIAEMRLQWWRDALEEIAQGGPVRRHEVTSPLADAIDAEQAAALDPLVAARRWDIYRDPFEDSAHFEAYLRETSGLLTHAAAGILGTAPARVALDAGYAAGLAAFLRAIPQLEAAGRVPLLDGTPDGVRALAQTGLARLADARAARAQVARSAAAAFLPTAAAEPVLKAAVADPRCVAEGRLPDPGPAVTLRVALGRW
ncbi:squalene/phytoene synthase family protein [Sulfitobacter sp. S190]|uniref:squalene/phytoene synthase family protein n=1 Tax=Sulfitobacter sp. S190 TaxID=2867022 RepID=UPI0021A5F062|nr:squalene/phytoene synthase family protein [Sulfitobacter sp. S190]UWR23787.1 squalene/phytoene synthase family protein [Sulfitobacter sp. S190]